MAELKPCPFCGQIPRMNEHRFYDDDLKGFNDYSYGVECPDCFTQSFQFYKSKEKAIKAWNTRAEKE